MISSGFNAVLIHCLSQVFTYVNTVVNNICCFKRVLFVFQTNCRTVVDALYSTKLIRKLLIYFEYEKDP